MAAGPTTRKAAGTPVLIGPAGANVRLERVTLSAGAYTEAWLQQLAFGVVAGAQGDPLKANVRARRADQHRDRKSNV